MEEQASLAAVARNFGAAWRALRLYPPSSPMPLQASEAVCRAVGDYMEAEPALKFVVVREGFVVRGLDGAFAGPGVPELVDALGSHGVAELHFVSPPTSEEVLAFLAAVQQPPRSLQGAAGLRAALDEAGVGAVRLVPVTISKVETMLEIPEEEADKFLAELAADSQRLAVWLRSLLSYEDEGLVEGLSELASAAGDVAGFGRSMAAAFLELETDDKDRLLEVSMDLEAVRHITTEMLSNLSAVALTAAIRGGRYGRNAMTLSWALTRLPVEGHAEELARETEAAMRAGDTGEDVVLFLEHMLEARCAGGGEPALIESGSLYRTVQQGLRIPPDRLAASRQQMSEGRRLNGRGIATILHLLELAEDFGAFCRVLESLERAVPHLLEIGDAELAMIIVRKMSGRTVASSRLWPELDDRLARATEEACGPRSMAALLAVLSSDEGAVEHVRELVTLGGEKAARALADSAMLSEEEGAMACAETVLGRRLPELLAPQAPQAEARHAAKLAELFAHDGGPHCMQALGRLATRSEDRVRAETARGICAAGGSAVSAHMPRLLRDGAPDVAMVAARALGRRGDEEAVRILAGRLAELDDDKELMVAREIIGALASSPLDPAEEALRRFAGSGSFLRKRRSSEMRRLAKEALGTRPEKGAS